MSKLTMRKNFEKSIQQAAHAGLSEHLKKTQKSLDSFARQHKNRPMSEIKPALKRLFSRMGGSISDPELTDCATKISEGTKVQLRVK